MPRTIRWACVAGLLALTPAVAEDKATIQALSDELAAAIASGDGAAAAALYTEDARLLPPGAVMVTGRDGIAQFWNAAGAGIESANLTTEEVERLGDGAVSEIGSFVLTTKGDAPQDIAGKYVVIWEEVDGEWRLATDIWNMND